MVLTYFANVFMVSVSTINIATQTHSPKASELAASFSNDFLESLQQTIEKTDESNNNETKHREQTYASAASAISPLSRKQSIVSVK